VELLDLKKQKIHRMELLDRFVNLQKLVLDNNKIDLLRGMKHLRQLEEFSIRDNLLESVKGLEYCVMLKYVDLSMNKIDEISENVFKNLKLLVDLDISDNPITSFIGLSD
jgi:Leucine-rich repeat (LRR) protein